MGQAILKGRYPHRFSHRSALVTRCPCTECMQRSHAVCVQNIDPTLLLTAFLPILLFAGAFALEWHTVRRLIWSSLLLAGTQPSSKAPPG